MKKHNAPAGTGKEKGRRIAATACFAVAALLLLWVISERVLAERRRSEVHTSYQQVMGQTPDEALDDARNAARQYNALLAGGVEVSDGGGAAYESLLDLAGNGLMGYVEIPKLHTELPIYHGTGADVLEKGVGHLLGSSLPVGGESTHAALSGHSGLAGSKMFSDIGKLQVGDPFMLKVLGDTLTYQVDAIHVVKPGDTTHLAIERGRDYCTLITCTPYGINTHRLLVRGVRVEPATAQPIPIQPEQTTDTVPEDSGNVWQAATPAVAAGVLLILICLLIRRKRCEKNT